MVPQFPEPTEARPFHATMADLPPVRTDDALQAQLQSLIAHSPRKVVVLDDDPTGPQAMQDVFVLTQWNVDALRRELLEPRQLFFLLTDTRALSRADAIARHVEVARNLKMASAQCGVDYDIVSRGDSTLRAHYPDELEPFGERDATILAPFFAEGGRFTIDDVQWVREAGWLVPAAQTVYARDPMLGYSHSNLRNWVEEKSLGNIRAADVVAITLAQVRRGGSQEVERVLRLARRHTIILNAASYHDLEVFTLALLRAEASGKRYLVRSAASFLKVRAGQLSHLPGSSLAMQKVSGVQRSSVHAGLVIVGSHVPRSSAQLDRLLCRPNTRGRELSIEAIIKGHSGDEVRRLAQWLNDNAKREACLVIYTSREREPRAGQAALQLGKQITSSLVDIVRSLAFVPRFVLVKGGWTASAIGTRALNVARAYAPAPIVPGVPVWILGEEARFPQMPYVIFPGNVGDQDALVAVIEKLHGEVL